MNIDRTITLAVTGVLAVAMATTVLGRSNSAKVIDAGASGFANVIKAALGQGVIIS